MQVQKRDIWSASGLQGKFRWPAAQFGFRSARSCMRCSQVGKTGSALCKSVEWEPRRAALSHHGGAGALHSHAARRPAVELRRRCVGCRRPRTRATPGGQRKRERGEAAAPAALCSALRCLPDCGRSAPRSRRASGGPAVDGSEPSRRPGICWRRCWSPAPTAASRHRRLAEGEGERSENP